MRPHRGILVVVCSVLTACAGDAPAAEQPPVPTAPDVEAAAGPEAAITDFDSSGQTLSAGLSEIHGLAREQPDALRDAALRHLETDDRHAAVYALALTADDDTSLAELRALLDAADSTERLTAANALVARGDKAGIPALISLLDSEDDLRFAVPPQQAWQRARFLLVQYTGQDLGLIGPDFDAARSAAARPAWERWWAEHGAALAWDAAERLYR